MCDSPWRSNGSNGDPSLALPRGRVESLATMNTPEPLPHVCLIEHREPYLEGWGRAHRAVCVRARCKWATEWFYGEPDAIERAARHSSYAGNGSNQGAPDHAG